MSSGVTASPGQEEQRRGQQQQQRADAAAAPPPPAATLQEDEDDDDQESNDDDEDQQRRARHERQLFQSRHPLLPSPARIHGILNQLVTLSMLGLFTFVGLLVRLGLVWLGTYQGQTVFPLLWAQVVGCALMGLFSSRRNEIEDVQVVHSFDEMRGGI